MPLFDTDYTYEQKGTPLRRGGPVYGPGDANSGGPASLTSGPGGGGGGGSSPLGPVASGVLEAALIREALVADTSENKIAALVREVLVGDTAQAEIAALVREVLVGDTAQAEIAAFVREALLSTNVTVNVTALVREILRTNEPPDGVGTPLWDLDQSPKSPLRRPHRMASGAIDMNAFVISIPKRLRPYLLINV